MQPTDIIPVDRQSIFGDTYNGVPSPVIPHTHPYPTRFHGPIYTTPRFMHPYREQAWQSPGDYVGPVPATAGFGAAGSSGPAFFGSATGSTILDTLIGAGLGYLVAPRKDDRILWAAAAGTAALLAGTLGLVGTVGAAFYVRREK